MVIVKTFLFQKVISKIQVTTTTSTMRFLIKQLLHYLKTWYVVGIIFGLLKLTTFFQNQLLLHFTFSNCKTPFYHYMKMTVDITWLFCMGIMCVSRINGLVFCFIISNAILVVACPTHSLNGYDKNYILTFINIIAKKGAD